MAHIVIVGGGLGGASLALLLARDTTHDISLIEQAVLASDTLPDTPSYDARSTALALGSAEILAGLGAWRTLAGFAAPIRHIQVSHEGHFGAARLDAAEESVAALGFVAENRHLGFALLRALRETRVAVHAPARLAEVTRVGDGWKMVMHSHANDADSRAHRVTTEATQAGEKRLDADLLIVADGVQSSLREALGIAVNEHRYGATAIVCNVTPRSAHDDVAFERFTRDGAIAILPLRDAGAEPRCAIVWSLPEAKAARLLAAGDDEFLAALSAAAGHRLGGFARTGNRSAYPLTRVIAAEQAVPGAVLLGNAAHLLHPVAGQGFNLTLRDAVALSAVLVQAEQAQEAVGSLDTLLRYVARRTRDQHLTAGLSHGLPSLFTSDAPLLGIARDLGLLAFDLVAPLKREFARQAMGIGVFTGAGSP
jgi:2-octaprenyl-6-methoxyphenol hydroxylase